MDMSNNWELGKDKKKNGNKTYNFKCMTGKEVKMKENNSNNKMIKRMKKEFIDN